MRTSLKFAPLKKFEIMLSLLGLASTNTVGGCMSGGKGVIGGEETEGNNAWQAKHLCYKDGV